MELIGISRKSPAVSLVVTNICTGCIAARALPGQQRPFDRQAPVVAAESSGFSQGAVAGDQPADRVASDGGADRAHGFRVPDMLRDIAVGRDVTGRHGQQGLPYLDLKRCADQVQMRRTGA